MLKQVTAFGLTDVGRKRTGNEDAYVVDVASPNTAETLAAGELHARIGIRVSPMGEFVFITVSKSPVDQTLNA